ncbi:unnamed protein product [Larinioides sclopetarius]|uniref:Uncharacterized protein n=1 Tax=Larinioides sclopetarius TaxID=280406 RepID=A0AAV2ABA5_9ARAC
MDTSAQCVETSMEYMKFCAYVVDKEMERFNLDFTVYQSFVTQLPGVLDVNFDIAYNRCAFMYKYTLCNIYFFKDCMNKFILEYPEFRNLVSKWTTDSDIKLCSLSCGPGLDYLSFMLSLSDHLTPPSFKNVTILSKYGAWRNTVGIVADALQEGVLSKSGIGKMVNFKNTEVVQANLLVSIPVKGLEALQHSGVILMVKTLNLISPGTNEEDILKTKLLDLISSMKPETTIFFIDTKPSLTLFLEVLRKFDGKFLFKPEHLSFRVPVTFSEEYKQRNGCLPVVCSRGAFFVWQKMSSFEPNPDFNICPINPPIPLKEIPENSVEKLSPENEEVLSITRTLKDLILPNNKNDNVFNNSLISDNNRSLQPNVSDIREVVPTMSNYVNIPKQVDTNKSASIQNLVTTQSVQDLLQFNLDEKNCSSHSLKKSSSIDNSFLLGSSKSIPFLGESDLLQNALYNSTIEETQQFTQKKISENKEKINVLKSNLAVKPTLESKATQTEFHQAAANSSAVQGLTDRVKRLISSIENEVQKNIPDGPANNNLHRSANYSSCSPNCSNNSDVDIKPQCCNGYHTKRENPISCCNHVHCCAVRHNMMHRCEMHCCQSCFHRCNTTSHRTFCENNIACTNASLAQPQIVIPLQNVSNDLLLKIISAAKSGGNPQ